MFPYICYIIGNISRSANERSLSMKRCNRLLCLTLSVSLLLGLLTGCGKKNADDNGTPDDTGTHRTRYRHHALEHAVFAD